MPDRIEETLPSERALTPLEMSVIEGNVIDAIRTVYDPEIPVNVYDLGLIYGVEVDTKANVSIKMTLTSPACPVAESLPAEVQERASEVKGVREVDLELVWDPPFSIERIPEHIRLDLGLF